MMVCSGQSGGTRTSILLHVSRPLYHCAMDVDSGAVSLVIADSLTDFVKGLGRAYVV